MDGKLALHPGFMLQGGNVYVVIFRELKKAVDIIGTDINLPVILLRVQCFKLEEMDLDIVFFHHQVAIVVAAELHKAQFVDIEIARNGLVAHGEFGVDGGKHGVWVYKTNLRILTCYLQVDFAFLYVKKIKQRTGCPVSSALDVVGDKWSLLIIRDVIMSGKNTYNEFLRSEEGIATNVLADRLAMLEEAGILVKEEHPDSKAKILYRLTHKGIDLLPVLVELILWADAYLPVNPAALAYGELLKKDKEAFVKKVMAKMKQG